MSFAGRLRRRLHPRQQLAAAIDRLGLSRLLLGARAGLGSPWLTVLTYHRVYAGSAHPFDPGVVDATPEEFDRQLAIIGRYFQPIALPELRDCFAGRARLPANPIVITFDDGYRDNFEVAAPLLARHGVRAVFFIATDYITRRRVFWWDRISYLLASATRPRLELTYPEPLRLDLAADLEGARARLLKLVKARPGLDVERLLVELAATAGVAWTPELEHTLAERLLMRWDDIRALRDAGHSIGSHTRTHRVLQTLDAEQLDDELVGSLQELERQLGIDVTAIAYPVGLPIPEGDPIRGALNRAGYQIGFSNCGGVTPLWFGRPDPFDVRRLPADRDLPDARFRTRLAVPGLG